jgi:uncharacterized protein (DUF2249 family)
MTDAPQLSDALRHSNRLLIRALRMLREAGDGEPACRIAAEAWSAIRHILPEEAERLNQALHYLTRHANPSKGETPMPDLQQLDVRELPPRQRHALIFETCGDLTTGDAIVLVNDHDPRPLYYQFEAEQPGRFGWEYLERGPEVWRVRITRQAA